MKIANAVVASLLLAAAPLAAQAEDMSYSYIDLGWVNTDFDGLGESADGPGVRGSIAFGENFFAFGEYTMQEADVLGVSVDVDQIAVGLGGRLGISDRADLVGRVGYTELDASGAGASADADGYLVSAGIRGQVTDSFELEGHVIHTDLGSDGGDETALAVGGRYFFTKTFAVGAEYRSGDDTDTWMAGVRFSF